MSGLTAIKLTDQSSNEKTDQLSLWEDYCEVLRGVKEFFVKWDLINMISSLLKQQLLTV